MTSLEDTMDKVHAEFSEEMRLKRKQEQELAEKDVAISELVGALIEAEFHLEGYEAIQRPPVVASVRKDLKIIRTLIAKYKQK